MMDVLIVAEICAGTIKSNDSNIFNKVLILFRPTVSLIYKLQ